MTLLDELQELVDRWEEMAGFLRRVNDTNSQVAGTLNIAADDVKAIIDKHKESGDES